MHFALPDVERTRHIENVEHFKQQLIQLRDVEPPHQQYHSGQWYGSESVTTARIAQVAKPLSHVPKIEYTGGEGLVSPPERVFLFTEEVKESSKGTAWELSNFQEQNLHAGRPWNFATDGYGKSLAEQPELLSPKPVRTVTKKPKTVPTNTAYDPAQTAAADIWEKIHKGELQPSRRKPEKKVLKSTNAPIPEVLQDFAEFENDALQDIDLGSSTKEWAKASVSSAYVTKRPIKRGSFDSVTTIADANNVSIERPASYVKHKQSIDTEAAGPRLSLDRAAEMHRKILETRNRMAERKKQEEEERQTEERRQAEEREQRAAEQQRLVEEKRRQKDEERARSLTQVIEVESVDSYDTNGFEPQLWPNRRRSNTSTVLKRERKTREKPLTHSPKRANTFANDATPSAHNSMTDKKPGGSSNGTSRSMSMNDQARPDFNTTITSVAEGGYADNSIRMRDAGNSRTIEAANPFSDSIARRSDGSTRTSASSGYSSRYKSGRTLSKDTSENPFVSANDPKATSALGQRLSGGSNIESRSPLQRRSNTSSNDSRLSSDSHQTRSYPERNNSKTNAKSRTSVDSRSSQLSTNDREKPERESSLAARTISKLSYKSSSSSRNERNSTSSTQSWKRDGLGWRGGGKVFVAEPEEMSESEDGDGHGDWVRQEEERKDRVRMRGGAGEKTVESGCESGAGTEKDESDAGEVEHYNNDHSESEHSGK
jgi:hypothetical protein